MKQKICGIIYGIVLMLATFYIYRNIPIETTIRAYIYISAFTLLTLCVLYPIGRKKFIDRHYKFKEKPRLINDIKGDLKKNGAYLVLRILFLTVISPLAWFFTITGMIEEKFNLD